MTIETAAAQGLSSLFNIGPTVTILVLGILGGYVMFKHIIASCERREERAIQKWSEASDQFASVIKETNHGMREIAVIMARIETKVQK